MTIRTLFPITLIGFGLVTAPAFAEEKREALYEATLDIDRDGKMDRTVLVVVGGPGGRTDFGPMSDERYGLEAEESVDLYIYLAAGDEKLDLSRQPTLLKKAIVDTEQTNWVQPLESTDKGSLVATFVYGWGARQTWGESLTIVHRGGEFLVAGIQGTGSGATKSTSRMGHGTWRPSSAVATSTSSPEKVWPTMCWTSTSR